MIRPVHVSDYSRRTLDPGCPTTGGSNNDVIGFQISEVIKPPVGEPFKPGGRGGMGLVTFQRCAGQCADQSRLQHRLPFPSTPTLLPPPTYALTTPTPVKPLLTTNPVYVVANRYRWSPGRQH